MLSCGHGRGLGAAENILEYKYMSDCLRSNELPAGLQQTSNVSLSQPSQSFSYYKHTPKYLLGRLPEPMGKITPYPLPKKQDEACEKEKEIELGIHE